MVAEMPVSAAISDAVIGRLPCSAARILAWFWPRGAVVRLAALGRVPGVAARQLVAAWQRVGVRLARLARRRVRAPRWGATGSRAQGASPRRAGGPGHRPSAGCGRP